MTSSRNDGKDVEDAFIAILERDPDVVIERIRDQSDLRGLNRGRVVVDFAKPADFLVTQRGLLSYREVKSCQSSTSFPFSNIKPGQRSAALRQARVGGPYIFHIFSFGRGKWFLMPSTQFAQILNDGRSSAKFKELTEWNV